MWVKFVVGPTVCPKRFRVCSFKMIWIRISVILDRSAHGRSNESTNPLWTRITQFAGSTLIQVI